MDGVVGGGADNEAGVDDGATGGVDPAGVAKDVKGQMSRDRLS